MKKSLAQQAADALAGLGTAEEMRAAFAAMGFKGRRYNPTECPCGNCLMEHFGQEIAVTETMIRCGGRFSHDDDVIIPLNAQSFVRNMDAGLYPELVEE